MNVGFGFLTGGELDGLDSRPVWAVEFDQLANLGVAGIASATCSAAPDDIFHTSRSENGYGVSDLRLLDLQAMADHSVSQGFRAPHRTVLTSGCEY